MISLAKHSIERPKAALIGWLIAGIALSLIGLGVAHSLSPSVTVVPGTDSSKAQQLATSEFGPTQLVPILLEGPKTQLNYQGPKLVTMLSNRPHTRVLSAWDSGTASAGLRPSPTAAMIIVSVDRAEKDIVKYDQPQIQNLIATHTSGQVKYFISGQPSIDRALKDASLNNLRQTELIAIGILFLLLLIGLRAPIAALLVTAVGLVSTLAGFGEVAILGKFMHLDPVGVALGTMTGLMLGVGFSLLILDRFHREEWPDGVHPREAATAALRDLESTGKAVLVAGTGLIIALALVAVVGPRELMVSLGTGMLTCAMFATGGAVVVMPAAMVLLGRRIDAFSFPAPAPLARMWSRVLDGGNWVTRHAVYIGFAATAVLGAIAIPALALNSGAPSVTQLPKDSNARIAFQEITRVMGPGWATPFNLIVVANKGAITDPAMLASINALQTQIAKNPTVDSVTGPGTINLTAEQLKKFGPGLVNSVKVSKQSKKDLLKLIAGLGQAGAGSGQLKAGLEKAVSGANQLNGGAGQALAGAGKVHSGSAQIQAGAGQLTGGLGQLSGGLNTLSGGLNQANSGAQQLKAGSAQALEGATQLEAGLRISQAPAAQSLPAIQGVSSAAKGASAAMSTAAGSAGQTKTLIAAAENAMAAMTKGKTDPRYTSAVAALNSAAGAAGTTSSDIAAAQSKTAGISLLAGAIAAQAPGLVAGLNMLHSGASGLQAGIDKLHGGNAQLASGTGQLASGGQQAASGGQLAYGGSQKLTSALGQLTAGTGALQSGLGQLASGTGQLAYGLAAAPNGAGQLQTGLGLMQAGVIKARGQVPSTADLEKLFKQSPGMFSSGYFVLAAVAGARGSDRNAATFALNLDRGGTSGQIVVISKYGANDPRTVALRTYLAGVGRSFGVNHNAQVAVGGPAGNLTDMTGVAQSKIWIDVAVIAIALMVVLMLALRAVALPIVATAFSLLVAAATFGVLEILFGGSNPPLGGPGYMDPMTIIGIFAVVFGISAMFATLLLMRTREAYVTETDGRSAIRIGLRQTAAAATGAGLVMVAALIPFAASDLINVRQFGVGVAVAVLLEVLIVRPVLMPAAETVLGRFGWWPTEGVQPPTTMPPTPPEEKTRRMPRLQRPRPTRTRAVQH